MKQSIKYIIFVIVCFVVAVIFTHFNKGTDFGEAYTILVASLALLRTCKEEKDNGNE